MKQEGLQKIATDLGYTPKINFKVVKQSQGMSKGSDLTDP